MWYPVELITEALDGDGDINWKIDLDKFDLDKNGVIDANDCPFTHGSAESKLWWKNILESYVKSQITSEHIAQYGEKVVGVYKGKALVPGERGPGQGDFQFLVDKLRVTQGVSWTTAKTIAGKVNAKLYG